MPPRIVSLSDLPGDLALHLLTPAGGGVLPEALSAEEAARLRGFSHPDRRRSFVLGRLAARELLAERLGLAPRDVPLVVAPSGALRVEGHPLHVSLSHAGRGAEVHAVAAVAARPVGVDLERAVERHPQLLARLLGPEEAAVPGLLPVAPVDTAALVWTLKEAVLKGCEGGFRLGGRSVVLIPQGEGAAVARVGPEAWEVRYARAGGFWLAVAWRD